MTDAREEKRVSLHSFEAQALARLLSELSETVTPSRYLRAQAWKWADFLMSSVEHQSADQATGRPSQDLRPVFTAASRDDNDFEHAATDREETLCGLRVDGLTLHRHTFRGDNPVGDCPRCTELARSLWHAKEENNQALVDKNDQEAL